MRKERRYRHESKEIEIFEDGKVKVGPWGETHLSSDKPIARPRLLVSIEICRNWEDLGEVEVEEGVEGVESRSPSTGTLGTISVSLASKRRRRS